MSVQIHTCEKENISTEHNTVNLSYQTSPTVFPEHWHLAAEFILTFKDSCHYKVGNKTYFLNSGDLLLVWPAEIHSIISTPGQASLILQFSPSIIDDCQDLAMYYSLLRARHLISRKKHPELNQVLCSLMMESWKTYQSKDPFIETRVRINIYQMLILLMNERLQDRQHSTEFSVTSSDLTFHKIQNACAYITAHCEQPLTQKEVAEHIGFSHFYFSRVFKECTDFSFSEYLTRQRIRRATRLLVTEGVSVTNAAFLSGFQSVSSFNRLFRQYMECSPTEYRKKYHFTDPSASDPGVFLHTSGRTTPPDTQSSQRTCDCIGSPDELSP